MGRHYIVCFEQWSEGTAERFLGPFETEDDAQAAMPFALATFPRDRPWAIWDEDDMLYQDGPPTRFMRRIGALDDK